MDNIPILIDGPNFINRLIELGIKNKFIACQLTLRGLLEFVNQQLKKINDIKGRCNTVEFVCSTKRFGPTKNKFTEEEQNSLLHRLMRENGVYVDKIDIPGSTEKGVDSTIQSKIEDFVKHYDAIVLVSHDRDYIPVMKKLRHKIKIITVAINDKFPHELANESFAVIELGPHFVWLFNYSYPFYPIETFTVEQCEDLYSNADDRKFNRVVITKNNYVCIANDEDINNFFNFKCYFESLVPYNGYVGPLGASDENYIKTEYQDIMNAYKKGFSGYIDFHP